MEKGKLEGQVAIITGASSGIGAGCAKELAKAGAAVVINYPVPGAKAMAEAVVIIGRAFGTEAAASSTA